MIPPNPPRRAEEIYPWARRLQEYLLATRPVPGPGLVSSQSSSGITFSVRPQAPKMKIIPLYVKKSRPAYVPEPAEPLVAEPPTTRVFLEWGDIGGVVAENWDDYWDLSGNAEIWADINLVTTGSLRISSWTVETGEAMPEVPDWNDVTETARPGKHYIRLAQYFHESATIINTGGGSIELAEHVSNITSDVQGGIRFFRHLSHWRLHFATES